MHNRDSVIADAHRARQAGEWPSTTYLGSLQAPTLEALLRLGAFQRFKRGEALVHEGERDARSVLFLTSGCVKVTAGDEKGAEALLAIRVSGDIIGELALIDGEPRSATVVACQIEPSLALSVSYDEFRGFLADFPDGSMCLARTIAKRLRWANRRRVESGAARSKCGRRG